jgi:hypothetical protein
LPDPLNTIINVFSIDFEYIYVTRQSVLTDLSSSIITFQESNLLDHGPGSLNEQRKNKKKKIPITYIPESLFFQKIKE